MSAEAGQKHTMSSLEWREPSFRAAGGDGLYVNGRPTGISVGWAHWDAPNGRYYLRSGSLPGLKPKRDRWPTLEEAKAAGERFWWAWAAAYLGEEPQP